MIRSVLLLAGIGLLFAVIAGFGGSAHPALDSLSVLRPHLTLLAGALFLLALMLRAGLARLGLALPMVAGLLGMAPDILQTRYVAAPSPHMDTEDTLHVISYNMLYSNSSLDEITDWLLAENPHVIALQEGSQLTKVLMTRLRDRYPHWLSCPNNTRLHSMVITRLKLTGRGGCLGSQSDRLAWLEVTWQGAPLSLVSVHLQWPWPRYQAHQLDRLERDLRGLPQPALIAGDFNAMPWSHSVARIADMTGTRRVSGFLPSFVGTEFLLPLPIDHVLAPDLLSPLATRLGPAMGSDHRPVSIFLQ